MSINLCGKRSFASTAHYAPGYRDRCEAALAEALGSTPAYASWRASDPGPAADVFSRLACLPALTKRDLRAFGPQAFVPHGRDIDRALAAGEIELVETSGVTSDRVTNVWYQPWWNASEASSWQLNAHTRAAALGGHREAILTSPWCAGVPCEDDYLTMKQRTLDRFLYLSERSDPSTWSSDLMDRMAAEINSFRPLVIEANPSFLAMLSRHLIRRRLRVHSPRIIVLTYENPSALHRRWIARAFDAAIASSYGATEAGYVFMECEAGRLHQVTESCHVDFLPFASAHGGPGVGRMLVTTFGNLWRSLLRFDIGDIVRLSGETPCPCGRREGLTVASIEGRAISLTLTSEGRAVTQGAVDRALAEVEGLAEYQLRQTEPSELHLRSVVSDADARAPGDEVGVRRVVEEAREAVQGLYGAGMVVTAESVAAIAPDPPGKYILVRRHNAVDADALLDGPYAPRPLDGGGE
jgi:phenylacetate-CoA ligase